ncbi:hypothetical protein K440DRAFT_610153 [Wilcoxina mikolae CBS 423.85]|nr:hypothetical protein K440DRAFT_610153 [Wilcoxina mikolae CBS 423.85]
MAAARSGSLLDHIFTILRTLQLLLALSIIPLFSLFFVRLVHQHVPHPPHQFVFSFIITLLTFIYTTTTLLLHVFAALHYPTVVILDTTLTLLFLASSILLGLPLARLSCSSVPTDKTPHTGDYKLWITGVRAVCVQTKVAWHLVIILGAVFVVTAVCGWKMMWWRGMPQGGGGEQRDDEEEFMPVVKTPALDGVIGEGSLREEIERGLQESRYTPSPWGRRRSVSVSVRQGL